MSLNPYLAIFFAATIGGSSGVFIKLLNLPSTSITFFRVFVPVVILLGYFGWKRVRVFHGNYWIMLVASALNAARMFLYMVAYLYTSIGNAVIILFTWPIFATLFGMLLLKERVTKRTALLIGVAFLGIMIMYLNKEITFGNRDVIGMGAMLLSAIIFSLTAVFLPFIFINEPLPTLTQTIIASIYGFLVGIAAFLLFFFALKRLPMNHFSLFTYWEVPAALIFGAVFFREAITIDMIIGGTLILIAGISLREKEAAPD